MKTVVQKGHSQPKWILLIVLAIFCLRGYSQIKLPAIISSNMVLQRNTEVTLWGWAGEKKKVKIHASWLPEEIELVADQHGRWSLKLNTTRSKKPQTIRFMGENSDTLLDNILFGEVWLCSGQSNMQQPVRGYFGQPVFGSQEAIIKAHNPSLRLFSVARVGSLTPLDDLEDYNPWSEATPEVVSEFSAVGYFFASQLQELLDVPVGMIHASWGGSTVEPWMSGEVLEKFEEEDISMKSKMNHTPTALFNAMISPIIPYSLKGFLWYQGESNRLNPATYKKLFPAMVQDWLARWALEDAPFYFVQIAPFGYWDSKNAFQDKYNSAFMREAQLQCVDLIPNSGIVITLDVGDSISVHPPRKKKVADRLLGQALGKTYEFEGLNPESPTYESMEVKENKILLSFGNALDGLYAFKELDGFEIAGEDKVFYAANATIHESRQVLVWSEKVEKPIAVRYAWSNWVVGSLFGINLLPVSSFRTDEWDDASVRRE